MKKILYLIILLLIPFIVNAKQIYEVKWSKNSENDYDFIKEKDNKFFFIESGKQGLNIVAFDQNGNETIREEYNILSPNYEWSFNELKKRDIIYEERTKEDGTRYFLNPPLIFELYLNDNGYWEQTSINYKSLTEEEKKEYTGEYYDLYNTIYKENIENVYNLLIQNDYTILVGVNEDNYTLYIYDKNYNRILKKDYDQVFGSSATDIDNNNIYIIVEKHNHKEKKVNFILERYNLQGTKISEEDITQKIQTANKYTNEELYESTITDLNIVNGGILLTIVHSANNELLQQCINGEDIITQSDYSVDTPNNNTNTDRYTYCINEVIDLFKNSRNSRSSIDPDNNLIDLTSGWQNAGVSTDFNRGISKSSTIKLEIQTEADIKVLEGIGNVKLYNITSDGYEFLVEPEPNYEIEEIVVTDINGNKQTFKDRKFILPTNDVTIEAKFISVNPNTVDHIIIGIGSAFISALMFIIIAKKFKWITK